MTPLAPADDRTGRATDLATLTADAATLEPCAAHDRALALFLALDGFKQRVAELDRFVRDQLLAWCEVNGKLELGDGTYYHAKVPTDRPCHDIPAAVEQILSAVGGDVAALAGCIASGGIKHGAAAKVLPPDVYDRLFPRRTRPTLAKGGKALVRVDPKWIEQNER